jgi:very-short-patch-repair endonuclease
MNEQHDLQSQRERLLKVFEFLKAYTELRYPPVREIGRQLDVFWVKDLPPHHSVELFHEVGTAETEGDQADIVLRIARPVLFECPEPPEPIADWLMPGWQEIEGTVAVHPSHTSPDKNGGTLIEYFDEVTRRPALLKEWQQSRTAWQITERPARQAIDLFEAVYEWYGRQEREAESIEILYGDGLLHCPGEGGKFDHPVLLQKLELEFNPEGRQPEFVFRKQEHPPELYLEFLRALPKVNHLQIARCADELKKTELFPFDNGDTSEFLQRLIQGIFPTGGQLLPDGEKPKGPNPTIRRDPVIFMRQRRTGLGNFFDLVLEDVAKRTEFPTSLLQIVGLVDNVPAATEKAQSISLGNEDEDILLSKPANREQLEIARQLARRNCVLVQGPPGTGKTHTIANLLGHLLAQGKRVLVTAHTPKALRVLREKVVEPLQPLCISVLQNDKQSQEELQQSVRKIHVRLAQDDQQLAREAERLKQDRRQIIEKLRHARTRLLEARQDEIRGVVFGKNDIRPVDAAKRVQQGAGADDWIPSPISLGQSAPLPPTELVALYQTNTRISLEDERALNTFRPGTATLPTPKQFNALTDEITDLKTQNLRYRAELWDEKSFPSDLTEFDRMLELAAKAIEFFRDGAPWQLEAVQAGRDGNEAKQVWLSLTTLIESSWQEIQESYALVIAHGPHIDDPRSPRELLPIADEIIAHIEAGKSFGRLTKLTKSQCHQLISAVKISGRAPNLENSTHFRAVRASLRMPIARQELVERWERLMTAQGGPPASELSDKPEQVCRPFISQIQTCLDWHSSTWLALEANFKRLGFNWPAYLDSTPPGTGANAELRRLRNAVLGDLEKILKARAGWLRQKHLDDVWTEWRSLVQETNESEAAVTQLLRQALRDASPSAYQQAYDELARLKNLEPDLVVRRNLLSRLNQVAPAWATAIKNRHPFHLKPEPPGDPQAAWEWRQLHDELENRANISLDEIQQQIERLSRELLGVTAELVEKLTWVSLIRQTTHEQKQALGAYAAMRKKLAKSGKGVRDAEFLAAARREMVVAKGAVPVWIMPLNEVADAFDPRTSQFDVVIIDEASQCDPMAMFALYLGKQTVVVGDDEQVTPVAVGLDMELVKNLITVHLQGIPRKELYDGETSIYEFAQFAFAGVIRLVEHFRCAPNIIAFSNSLSYKGEIQPLREATSIKLTPHVVPFRVEAGLSGGDDTNDAEAEAIASLICAAVEQPEYAVNEAGKPMSFGVVSLIGDQQAMKVDTLLHQRLEPAEYKRRQILCGNPAQFQGDERDVMFLSVVDTPSSAEPLPLRQEGPKKIFKKRFNVAVSRARDQIWVVHSLNHTTDLKPGDYRRLLIEHAIDPGAWERELKERLDQTESILEERVAKQLIEAGYVVQPQYKVGNYRVDMVVAGGGKRLAVECDGERDHGPEKLQEDMNRQAILERLGWQFVRIRGSVLFRDEKRAMKTVFRRLEELGITPDLEKSLPTASLGADSPMPKLIRRAEELRRRWKNEKKPPQNSSNKPDRPRAAPERGRQALSGVK